MDTISNATNTDMSTNNVETNPAVKYRVPSLGADYKNMAVDLPMEQPLIFYLDGSKAFYLPHEDTSDESTHDLPQGVIDTLTKKRIFQMITMRQGQSGMFHVPIQIWDSDGRHDMSDVLMRFEGRDASGAVIYDDENINRIQANQGMLDWQPSAVISQTAGYFKNAHFVIEDVDRTKILATLDFSIDIIANDVAMPVVQEFYASEYVRLLAHMKEMQTSGDHQFNYLYNAYAAIVATKLKEITATMKATQDQLAQDLKDGNDKVDSFISVSKSKLDELNVGLSDSQTKMNALEKQITDDGLVTKADLYVDVQMGINNGQIDVNVNDSILDSDVSSKIDLLTSFLEGSNGE